MISASLSQNVIDDLTIRLTAYLTRLGNFDPPVYVTSGGSAAVFRVQGPDGIRAFKAFDPKFFEGSSGDAERRRLDVQRRLIGHQCAHLVQTYRVEEFGETAFMEMEFVAWPNLKEVLGSVPDEQVSHLLGQLVNSAIFLETQGIVHRDIKPENIHVAPDFSALKLLDLGVARDIEAADGLDASITDHGNKRPFLATAQYSSPEYLFRLDEPNARLWKGLTFYQIGAVLHDLIMKVPLFNQEVSLDNRWLISKAVLVKIPSFVDGYPGRLSNLKALASRCLVKDLDTRLQLVNWQDFESVSNGGAIESLRSRLDRRSNGVGTAVKMVAELRLLQEREAQWKQLVAGVREGLISICKNTMPLTTETNYPGGAPFGCLLTLSVSSDATITCMFEAKWGTGYHERSAEIELAVWLNDAQLSNVPNGVYQKVVCTTTAESAGSEAAQNLLNKIAEAIERGLDFIEAGNTQSTKDAYVLFPQN